MVIGAVIWAVFEAGFLLFALTSESKPLIYLFYGVRGLGYPLFAFAFLTWINLAVPRERRGRASGWFWFAFTAGLPVIGTGIAAGRSRSSASTRRSGSASPSSSPGR